ncbi:MAG: hypothetical protein PWQ91_351 [Eubacteriales bacterium]|nr:hypothetical protein [Eubacteriales bacterium]
MSELASGGCLHRRLAEEIKDELAKVLLVVGRAKLLESAKG